MRALCDGDQERDKKTRSYERDHKNRSWRVRRSWSSHQCKVESCRQPPEKLRRGPLTVASGPDFEMQIKAPDLAGLGGDRDVDTWGDDRQRHARAGDRLRACGEHRGRVGASGLGYEACGWSENAWMCWTWSKRSNDCGIVWPGQRYSTRPWVGKYAAV